jgi:hypothetical protein
MSVADRWRRVSIAWLVEVFVAANLGFLSVDVYVAHSENEFRASAEWVPIGFSVIASLALLPGLFSDRWRRGAARGAGAVVGVASLGIGLAGMVFHLESSFFELETLKSLVYTAPFAAPLAYMGLGLLLLLDRLEEPDSIVWAQWVLLLALGGMCGNLVLALADHAQNGFFSTLEWVPVIAAAFGVSFLATALAAPTRRVLRLCLALQGVEALVGVAGFGLHLASNLHGPESSMWKQMVFGAPVLAPLLFADLAILAALGLIQALRVGPRGSDPASPHWIGSSSSSEELIARRQRGT